MWKKGTDISGVSNGSLVDLKAVLYKREQDLKRHVSSPAASFTKRVQKRKRLQTEDEAVEKRNKGIEDRISRDEEQWKLAQEPSAELIAEKLKEKSAKYQKFIKAGTIHNDGLIDFEKKNWQTHDEPALELDDTKLEKLQFLKDFAAETTRKVEYSQNGFEFQLGSEEYEAARQARVSTMLEVSKETEENRSKVQNIKQRRQEEKLRRLQQIQEKATAQDN